MIAPEWVCFLFAFYLYVWLPLQAWLIDYPGAVQYRNEQIAKMDHQQDHTRRESVAREFGGF